jgi:hypothetical protein
MGAALQEAEIFFADQAEHYAMDALVLRRFTRFLREACPNAPRSRLRFDARLLVVTLESVGRAVAAMKLPPPEVRRWAQACADMVAAQVGLV